MGSAFPALALARGQRPHCVFRGLLKLHTRYGLPSCSPPFRGLCREVPIRPVSQPNRPPAIESNHQLFEWVLPPLVICPFRGHTLEFPPKPTDSIASTYLPPLTECSKSAGRLYLFGTSAACADLSRGRPPARPPAGPRPAAASQAASLLVTARCAPIHIAQPPAPLAIIPRCAI